MTTHVTEGAALVSRVSRLAALPQNARARARALPSLNLKKKRDCSQSNRCILRFTVMTSCNWQEKETDGAQSFNFSHLLAFITLFA